MHTQISETDKLSAVILAVPGTVEKGIKEYQNIESIIRKTITSDKICWAYTSKTIRRRIKEQGRTAFSLSERLEELYGKGYKKVFIQPLHLVAGVEYNILIDESKNCPFAFEKTAVGKPLLNSKADTRKIAEHLIAANPPKNDRALLFVGHGSVGQGARIYSQLHNALQDVSPNAFLGTCEGEGNSAEKIIALFKQRRISRAILTPFLLLPQGFTAAMIIGNDPNSWKSQLNANGIEAAPTASGLAEIPSIAACFADNLQNLLKENMHT